MSIFVVYIHQLILKRLQTVIKRINKMNYNKNKVIVFCFIIFLRFIVEIIAEDGKYNKNYRFEILNLVYCLKYDTNVIICFL